VKGLWVEVTRKPNRGLSSPLPRSLLVQMDDNAKILDIKIQDPQFPPDLGGIQRLVGGQVAKTFNGRDWNRRGVE
jgi:hypothetical protein